MITITVADFASHVEKYVEEAERGEIIELERDGKVVAIVAQTIQAVEDYWNRIVEPSKDES